MGLFRTDYVMDVNSSSTIKQIETNTISCAFPTIGQKTYHLHKYLLTELEHLEKLKNVRQVKFKNVFFIGQKKRTKISILVQFFSYPKIML